MDDNPTTAYEELGPTRRSTFSGQPGRGQTTVPKAIHRMVGELGLRYRPSAQADLEAHAASIALLALDLADVPPHLLEQAIAKHVRTSHFMPKASELIALAQQAMGVPTAIRHDQSVADKYNETMSPEGRAKGLSWSIENGELRLGAA